MAEFNTMSDPIVTSTMTPSGDDDPFFVLRDCREFFQERLVEIARHTGISSPSVIKAFSQEIGEAYDELATATPYASGPITASQAQPDQHELAERTLQAVERLLRLDQPLAYARVDLVRDDEGGPRLLELELTEPSLFFEQATGSAERFAAALGQRLLASSIDPGCKQ